MTKKNTNDKKRDLNQGKKKTNTLEKRAAPAGFSAVTAIAAQGGGLHASSNTYDNLQDSKAELRAKIDQVKVEIPASRTVWNPAVENFR